MGKLSLPVLICSLLLLGSSDPANKQPYDPDHLYPVASLQKDLDVLAITMREAHAYPFLYTSADTFAEYTSRIRASLQPMTDRDFLKMIAPLVTSVGCGHTYIYPSQACLEHRNRHGMFFPIPIRIFGQRIFTGDTDGNETGIPPGSQILAINGRSPEALLRELLPLINADGYIITSKLRRIEDRFAVYYHRYIEQPDTFRILYLTPEGQQQSLALPAVPYARYRQLRPPETAPVRFWTDDRQRVGILRIESLYTVAWKQHNLKPRRFLEDTFRQLQQHNIPDLIIDIRGNAGGSVYLAADLLAFFADTDLRWCREYRISPTTRYTCRKAMQWDPLVAFKRLLTRPSGTHRVYPWYRLLKPTPRRRAAHFPGRVYLLIDGRTFSAASMLASMAATCDRVVTIGEETGGTACGNGVSPITVVLPHTRIRMDLPLGYIVLDRPGHPQPGRGVIPRYPVPVSPHDDAENNDAVLSFALHLATASSDTLQPSK